MSIDNRAAIEEAGRTFWRRQQCGRCDGTGRVEVGSIRENQTYAETTCGRCDGAGTVEFRVDHNRPEPTAPSSLMSVYQVGEVSPVGGVRVDRFGHRYALVCDLENAQRVAMVLNTHRELVRTLRRILNTSREHSVRKMADDAIRLTV